MKVYSVKEIFYTLQGEGARAGRPAIFLRFSGCNLWSGRESDRKRAACDFCDTDFIGTDGVLGGKYDEIELVNVINALWPETYLEKKYVVCTGGEPLLQLDQKLITALKGSGYEVAVETNGTIEAPEGIDWICMSPKPHSTIKIKKGDELKFIYPQPNLSPLDFEDLKFNHFFIQPMDGLSIRENTALAIEFCLRRPLWKLSLQTHKILGIN